MFRVTRKSHSHCMNRLRPQINRLPVSEAGRKTPQHNLNSSDKLGRRTVTSLSTWRSGRRRIRLLHRRRLDRDRSIAIMVTTTLVGRRSTSRRVMTIMMSTIAASASRRLISRTSRSTITMPSMGCGSVIDFGMNDVDSYVGRYPRVDACVERKWTTWLERGSLQVGLSHCANQTRKADTF